MRRNVPAAARRGGSFVVRSAKSAAALSGQGLSGREQDGIYLRRRISVAEGPPSGETEATSCHNVGFSAHPPRTVSNSGGFSANFLATRSPSRASALSRPDIFVTSSEKRDRGVAISPLQNFRPASRSEQERDDTREGFEERAFERLENKMWDECDARMREQFFSSRKFDAPDDFIRLTSCFPSFSSGRWQTSYFFTAARDLISRQIRSCARAHALVRRQRPLKIHFNARTYSRRLVQTVVGEKVRAKYNLREIVPRLCIHLHILYPYFKMNGIQICTRSRINTYKRKSCPKYGSLESGERSVLSFTR